MAECAERTMLTSRFEQATLRWGRFSESLKLYIQALSENNECECLEAEYRNARSALDAHVKQHGCQ